MIAAVITGKGWELVPPDIRQQADTVWFKSWLLFDPAIAMRKVDQPLLIIHGALDRDMPASNGDRLHQLGVARKKSPASATVRIVVPGVNHLLLPARTGEPDEYDSLIAQTVSRDVTSALVTWLQQTVK